MKSIMIIVFTMMLLVTACSETQEPVATKIDVPQPTLEDNHMIENTDATYYKFWNSFGQGEPSREGEQLLANLIDSGIVPRNAWFPSGPTPCDAMGAVTILVVEISRPNRKMLDFGFESDPAEWWIMNCGVPSLWHYSFGWSL